MNTQLSHESIYTVAYADTHEVFLDDILIGHLKYEEPISIWDKLIDLSGRDLIRNDYKKKIEKLKENSINNYREKITEK
jgi:hypothetical protein